MATRHDVRSIIRGLYLLADVHGCGGDPLPVVHGALRGGCRLVQVRCKGWSDDDALVLAREIVALCRAVGATCIVNDRPEVALRADAHGVHVGQLDGPIDAVRARLGPDRLIGRSSHSVEQAARAAAEADYVAFGPVYDTPNLSRPMAVRGLQQLAQVRATLPVDVPLVGIGGINATRLPQVRQAGADAWAIIGAVCGAPDPEAATRELLP